MTSSDAVIAAATGGPLSEEQVAEFLEQGFIGVAECMAAPGELERMNESCANDPYQPNL